MIYEAITNTQRLEIVDAENNELALLKANSLCEDKECLLYLRERKSFNMVWCYMSWIKI
jgi:hypothetical protein